MEVRIGVQNVARELVFESAQTSEEITSAVSQALSAGTVLSLVDEKGRQVVVPAASIGYVDIGAPPGRPRVTPATQPVTIAGFRVARSPVTIGCRLPRRGCTLRLTTFPAGGSDFSPSRWGGSSADAAALAPCTGDA
ncbi:DUF3107 domain-containing protein [Kineococcus endophyticus]|uniref:DUF3107 domain-containing protein n=1 Tax=Kineococcus endophyticus TaxID=1181883 RepID=UPI003F59E622